MSKKILNIVFVIGSILILVSSVLVMEGIVWGKYGFASGVGLFIIGRMSMIYTGNDFRLKRLNRFYFLSSLFLVIASYLQFKNSGPWVVMLLLVAITEFYTSIRASAYEKSNESSDSSSNDLPSGYNKK
jgi:hypothetical protein